MADKIRIVVLGAGGIIGQHLRISKPADVEAQFCRQKPDVNHLGIDCTEWETLRFLLDTQRPGAVINLAGEARPDVVEQNPGNYAQVNVVLPGQLSAWCTASGVHLVQVSTQAVYGGMPDYGGISPKNPAVRQSFAPPFGPDSPRVPVNSYGRQKLLAEQQLPANGTTWTILRPTFVLGVRPWTDYGRQNPVEQMLGSADIVVESESAAVQRQVDDRWFSVSFAWDVAAALWVIAMGPPFRRSVNIGIPYRTSRFVLASYLRPDAPIEAVSHDSFPGLAPRAIDTTYASDQLCQGGWPEIMEGLDRCKMEYERQQHSRRAIESVHTGSI